MSKPIAFILLLVASSQLFAGGSTGNGTITELFIKADGTLARVMFSAAMRNPDGCEKDVFYILEMDGTQDNSPFIAALLSAQASKSTIQFWLNGCTTGSHWGGTQPRLHSIFMR